MFLRIFEESINVTQSQKTTEAYTKTDIIFN